MTKVCRRGGRQRGKFDMPTLLCACCYILVRLPCLARLSSPATLQNAAFCWAGRRPLGRRAVCPRSASPNVWLGRNANICSAAVARRSAARHIGEALFWQRGEQGWRWLPAGSVPVALCRGHYRCRAGEGVLCLPASRIRRHGRIHVNHDPDIFVFLGVEGVGVRKEMLACVAL